MTTDELQAKFRAVMSVRHPFWSYAFRADGCGVHDDYMDPWVECSWQAFKAAHASRDVEVEALQDALFQISVRLKTERESDMDDMSWHTDMIARAQYLANLEDAAMLEESK